MTKREERLSILTQTDKPLWEAGVVFAVMDEAGRGRIAPRPCISLTRCRAWVCRARKRA